MFFLVWGIILLLTACGSSPSSESKNIFSKERESGDNREQVGKITLPSVRSLTFSEGERAYKNIMRLDAFQITDEDLADLAPDFYQYNLSVTFNGQTIKNNEQNLFAWVKINEGEVLRDSSIRSGVPIAEQSSNGNINRSIAFAREPDDADVGEYLLTATVMDVEDSDTKNVLISASETYRLSIENVYESPRLVTQERALNIRKTDVTNETSIVLPSAMTFEWEEWNLPPEMPANYTLRARYRVHVNPLEGGRDEVLLATKPDTDASAEERGLLRGGGLSGPGIQNQREGWTDYFVELEREINQAPLPSNIRLHSSDYNEGSTHNVQISLMVVSPAGDVVDEVALKSQTGNGPEELSLQLPLYTVDYIENYDKAKVSLAPSTSPSNRESLVQPGMPLDARNQIDLIVNTPDMFTTNGNALLAQYFNLSVGPMNEPHQTSSTSNATQIAEMRGVYVDTSPLEELSLSAANEIVSLPVWVGDRQVRRGGYRLGVVLCDEPAISETGCVGTETELLRVETIERLNDLAQLVPIFEFGGGQLSAVNAKSVRPTGEIEIAFSIEDRDLLEVVPPTVSEELSDIVLAGEFQGNILIINQQDPSITCSLTGPFPLEQSFITTDQARVLSMRLDRPICSDGNPISDDSGYGINYLVNFIDSPSLEIRINRRTGPTLIDVPDIEADIITEIPNLLHPFSYVATNNPPILRPAPDKIFLAPRVHHPFAPYSNLVTARRRISVPKTVYLSPMRHALARSDNTIHFFGDLEVRFGLGWDLFNEDADGVYNEISSSVIVSSDFNPEAIASFDEVGIPEGITQSKLNVNISNFLVDYFSSGFTNILLAEERQNLDIYAKALWLAAVNEPTSLIAGLSSRSSINMLFLINGANSVDQFVRFRPRVFVAYDPSFFVESLHSLEQINISAQVCEFPTTRLDQLNEDNEDTFQAYRVGQIIHCPANQIPPGFLNESNALVAERLLGELDNRQDARLLNPPLVQVDDLLINASDLPEPLYNNHFFEDETNLYQENPSEIMRALNISFNLRHDLLPPAQDGSPKDYLVNLILTDIAGGTHYTGFIVRIHSLYPIP